MSQYNANYEHKSTFNQLVIQQNEPMLNIDKYSILNDSKTFNDSKIQDEKSKIILVKLIYLLNQGESFSEQEIELLFFRVTKLLLSDNIGLKRLTYAILKMIRVQKYIHMLIQSLIKDLINNNPLIRIEALKFISVIQEKQYILQMERFVHKAISDQNIQVSNAALIVGIHIFNRFPQIVKKWQPEIQYMLIQQNLINFYALILLWEINKTDQIPFIGILRIPQQPQLQLVNLQILKFIKDSSNNQNLSQELIPFLIQSINQNDNLIFLESFNILVQHEKMLKNNLDQIIIRFKNILNSENNNIEQYNALKKIDNLIQIFGRSKQELAELMIQVEYLTQSGNISISQRSLQICLNQQINNKDKYIKYLFNLTNIAQCRYSFLKGLIELLKLHAKYGQLVLNTLQQIIFDDSEITLKFMAIQIIFVILNNSKHNYQIALEILFRLIKPLEFILQFFLVQIICWLFFDINIIKLEKSSISQCFQYLKSQFKNKKEDFVNISSKRYKLIKTQLLLMIETDLKKYQLMEENNPYQYTDNLELEVGDAVEGDKIQILSNSNRNDQNLYNYGRNLK